MKTKIALTKEQVDKLVETETKALQVKFDREIASIRKKYEFIEIDIQQAPREKQSEKVKVTPELFNRFMDDGLKLKEIATNTGYNEAYIRKLSKKFKTEKVTQL